MNPGMQPARSRSGALDQLTSLRFIAAFAVMLSHLTMLQKRPGSIGARLYDGLFHEGYIGVTFFYVLSGFIIAYAYRDALAARTLSYRKFLLRRAARIFPLHWVTAAAVAAYLLFIRHEPPSPLRLLLNATLLHAWAPEPDLHYSLNGPSWSLSCELFFYAMFPVLIALRVRTLALLTATMASFIGLAAFTVSRIDNVFSPALEWFFYVAPATRLLDFAVGILVFHAWQSDRLRALSGTGWEMLVMLVLPVFTVLMVAAQVPSAWRWQLAYLPLMALAVLVFAHGRGLASRLLKRPWPVRLGEASFALYLTHRPLVLLAETAGDRATRVPPVLLAAGLVCICVAVSLVVWRWFDLPMRRALEGRLKAGRGPVFPLRLGIREAALAPILLAICAVVTLRLHPLVPTAMAEPVSVPRTQIGINLSGIAPYNRQPVFANMIAQSEWFVDTGQGWKTMPADRLDAGGWVRRLEPGYAAFRPLALPPVPIGEVPVRCTWQGTGAISAGGIAHVVSEGKQEAQLSLVSQGGAEDGAWITLDRTEPADPVRDIDCRDTRLSADALFHPEFVAFLRGFTILRFLDWQRTNDNLPVSWARRTTPASGSQFGPDGVAIENMIALANEVGADPWFLMPYGANAEYVGNFARLVHQRLAPGRTVYVELGNEMWNDMFATTLQARRDGLAMGLDPDPVRAQTRRYAQRSREVMQIWTRVYADRPERLVRVLAGLNVYPDLLRDALDYQDTAKWIDAVATAPYIQLDLSGLGIVDADTAFSRLDGSVAEALSFAVKNKALATSYGKRYIAYEGGQHLVTSNLDLARRLQRDPRMARVYANYLNGWRTQIGDGLVLYAATSPIGDSGAWGLREYAGQPAGETPKLRAVRQFLSAN